MLADPDQLLTPLPQPEKSNSDDLRIFGKVLSEDKERFGRITLRPVEKAPNSSNRGIPSHPHIPAGGEILQVYDRRNFIPLSWG